MHGSVEVALRLLDQAAYMRDHANGIWRSAIKEAIDCQAPIVFVATRARTTIDDVLTIVDEPR